VTIIDPIWQHANINGNEMLIDQALRVSVESGATMNDVPIDTMVQGMATVNVEVGPVPEPIPPADVGCLPTPAFQHTWVLISSDTANYGVSASPASYATDGWAAGSRDLNSTSATLNFTSGSSHVFMYTTNRFPSISATGAGDAQVDGVFFSDRVRNFLVGTPPVAQLNITDAFPGSTISWVSDVTGTLGLTLHDGDTTFELNDSHLENPITVLALTNASTSLIVPVVPSSNATVISLDYEGTVTATTTSSTSSTTTVSTSSQARLHPQPPVLSQHTNGSTQ
jgi:hypothetical protein